MKNLKDDYSLIKFCSFWIILLFFLFSCFIIQRCNHYINNNDMNTFRELIEKYE